VDRRSRPKRLEESRENSRRNPTTRTIRREAIRLEDVWVAYAGSGKPAIREINLFFPLGKLVLITGPNGAGKTTLLETCLGLLKPYRGKAFLLGVDTKSRKILEARRKCSYVPQDFMKPPYESYTARQAIELGLVLENTPDKNTRVEWAAKLLGIEDLLDRPLGTLSGGQQQRVYLARALARKPLVMLLDEPFSSLDRETRKTVAEILRNYVDRENTTVIIVSHDTAPIIELADTTIWMNEGKVVKVEAK